MNSRRAQARSSSGIESILSLLVLLSVAIGTPVSGRAQTETALYRFAGYNGTNPFGGLVADSSGNLYGTTPYGGDGICNGMAGCGVVFELVNSSGAYTEKVLYRFTGGGRRRLALCWADRG